MLIFLFLKKHVFVIYLIFHILILVNYLKLNIYLKEIRSPYKKNTIFPQ